MKFLEEIAEREILTQQAFLNAIPQWVRDRIVCGTCKQLPTFLNLNGRGKMAEPYESKYRELLEEVEQKLIAKYHRGPASRLNHLQVTRRVAIVKFDPNLPTLET